MVAKSTAKAGQQAPVIGVSEWFKVGASVVIALGVLIGGVDSVVSRRMAPLESAIKAQDTRMQRIEQQLDLLITTLLERQDERPTP